MASTARKLVLLSALGGALEFYDFIIFAIFSPYISELFFPSTDKLASLLSVYAVFAIGYLIRPLGGIIFSHFGDKYGRKKTFICSIMVMAIPTFMIGLLPSYATIGIAAPILLIMLRILQGFSIGGEIPGAFTYSCEHTEVKSRCVTIGTIFAFFNLGIVLGSLMSLVLMQFFSQQQILNWAWRIPFLFGGFLGLISFQLRKKMSESPLFLQMQQISQTKIPALEAIKTYWREIVQGIALTWLSAVVINLLFIYLPIYLSTILTYPSKTVAWLNTLNLILNGILLIIVGFIADRFDKRKILFIGALSFICLSYFIFSQINLITTDKLIFSMMLISLMGACINVYPAIIFNLFPTRIRYTGLALTYNIGFAIFGGLTPLICTYLIRITENNLAPSYYLIISAICCLLAILTVRAKAVSAESVNHPSHR